MANISLKFLSRGVGQSDHTTRISNKKSSCVKRQSLEHNHPHPCIITKVPRSLRRRRLTRAPKKTWIIVHPSHELQIEIAHDSVDGVPGTVPT